MKFNNRERLDLTEWIIHFIHDRKPEDDISSLADIAELEGYTNYCMVLVFNVFKNALSLFYLQR